MNRLTQNLCETYNGNFGYENSFHSFAFDLSNMETAERIIVKAHELFMKYGIRSMSMDEIANHLGMSKKTIYQFFTDKDSLVEQVITIVVKENETSCSMHRLKSENAIHEIFLALDMLKELLSTMNPSLIYELEKYHPRAFKSYNDHKNKYLYNVIKKNLEWGMSEGLFREDIQPDILSRFRLASVFLVFNPELFPHGKYSIPEILTEITLNFLQGVATPKAQKLIVKYQQQRIKTKTA